ncbi:hypothetical protein HDU92_002498 [Lobulomyces angularis]|nr:hypothetical protein HDU92_002498 [Lobulomyces angularis]
MQEPALDEFGRDIKDAEERGRSPTHDFDDSKGRKRRRSTSPKSNQNVNSNSRGNDVYVPHYDRDGYVPGARYGKSDKPIGTTVYDQFGVPIFLPGLTTNNIGVQDPMNFDYLVSLKYFTEYLKQQKKGREPLDDDEVQSKFRKYKENFQCKTVKNFFERHKNEEWFREKYHMEESKTLTTKIAERKKELFKKFINDLDFGKFDSVDFDDTDPTAEVVISEDREDEDMEVEKEKEKEAVSISDAQSKREEMIKLVSEYDYYNIFVKSVPLNFKRSNVEALFSEAPGFKYFEISEPNPMRNFNRIGWIVFEDEESCKNAIPLLNQKRLDDFTFPIAPSIISVPKHRFVPFQLGCLERLQKDLAQIKTLGRFLDEESGLGDGIKAVEDRLAIILNNDAMTDEFDLDAKQSKEIKDLKKSVDFYTVYLRRVHLFDYYSGCENSSPEDFLRRHVHFRTRAKTDHFADKFLEKLDMKIQLRINKPFDGEDVVKMGGRNFEEEAEKEADNNIIKESEAKFRCKVCQKLFKGEEFVKKHVRAKHQNLFDDLTLQIQFFNAFARDPNKILPPQNQQHQPPQLPLQFLPMGMGGMPAFNNFNPGHGRGNDFGRGGHHMGGHHHEMYQQGGRGGFQGGQQQRGNYRGGRGRGSYNNRGDNNNRFAFPIFKFIFLTISCRQDFKHTREVNNRQDTRSFRSYVDLDAPPEGEIEINYD